MAKRDELGGEAMGGWSTQIGTRNKPGLTVFRVFGTLDGRPGHWTADGRFRMDSAPDPGDLRDSS